MKKHITIKPVYLFLIIMSFCFNIYSQNVDAVKNLFSLQMSPKLKDDNKIILIISELYSYGDAFKYHSELERGLYEIDNQGDNFLLKILNDNSSNISKGIN